MFMVILYCDGVTSFTVCCFDYESARRTLDNLSAGASSLKDAGRIHDYYVELTKKG